MFEKLGITLESMLFHLSALIVLIVALTFFLYKPVKKIIADHKKKLDDIFSQNDRLNAESVQMKAKYDTMTADAAQNAMRISQEATEKAQERANAIVNDAQSLANNLIKEAKDEVKATKVRLDNEFKKSVSKMAVEIAGKVLEREVSEKDNKKIIDECLSEWEK